MSALGAQGQRAGQPLSAMTENRLLSTRGGQGMPGRVDGGHGPPGPSASRILPALHQLLPEVRPHCMSPGQRLEGRSAPQASLVWLRPWAHPAPPLHPGLLVTELWARAVGVLTTTPAKNTCAPHTQGPGGGLPAAAGVTPVSPGGAERWMSSAWPRGTAWLCCLGRRVPRVPPLRPSSASLPAVCWGGPWGWWLPEGEGPGGPSLPCTGRGTPRGLLPPRVQEHAWAQDLDCST